MSGAEIKHDLLRKIDGLNGRQLKEIYGILQNYLSGNETVEEWAEMTAAQKRKIEKGIKQADANITKPLTEVTTRLRRKYGFNG